MADATEQAAGQPVETKTRRELVVERVRAMGYPSLYRACFDRHVDYQQVRKVIIHGGGPRTSIQAIRALQRLGVLDLFPELRASA